MPCIGETRNIRKNFDREYYERDFLELRYMKNGERIRNELTESENVSKKNFNGNETQDCIATAKSHLNYYRLFPITKGFLA
jgi:hypothetical protein